MTRRSEARERVLVLGAGKVGAGLSRALRKSGVRVTLRPARKGLPRAIRAGVVILAVRDRDLPALVELIRTAGILDRRSIVVHVSGALGAGALAPLRSVCAGVAQMHPMISFASARKTPPLERGGVHLSGDRAAVVRASRIVKRLGMTPRTLPRLDTVAYHAAAGLVANGAAALAAMGAQLLQKAGVPRETAPEILGPLLRSVAYNVEALGFPDALTGPVRRGDAGSLEKHLEVLRAKLPAALPLYLASAAAQLPLARALGDARPEALDDVLRAIAHAARARGGQRQLG
jgi:predicted short-subunit dehydrogenase-like oxidoreductase (DUF2520 family)